MPPARRLPATRRSDQGVFYLSLLHPSILSRHRHALSPCLQAE
uniref:Uncharacterized protein n=1 Tax=Arundo donax TaxID=35708 RepID=A0A0A9A1Z5_ARUDO